MKNKVDVAFLALCTLLVFSMLFVVGFSWATAYDLKEISSESFYKTRENLSCESYEYREQVKSACRESVEEHFGGEVLEDYILLWSDNGRLTLSYFWRDARACYKVHAGGDADSVAYFCYSEDNRIGYEHLEPTATFDGTLLELHLN